MIIQFILLCIEKIVTSGTRFGLIFYVLGSSEKTLANDFFYITTSVTLLITLCHLGTDTLIIGKEIKAEGVNQIFLVRFASFQLAILLLFVLFKFNVNWVIYIAIVFALLGASLPIRQLKALSITSHKTFLIDRTLPEVTCGLLRVIGMAAGVRELENLIILFFAPEVIYGVANSAALLKSRLNLKLNNLDAFERHVNYSILWSAVFVLSLYGLQRGDILLITSSGEYLAPSIEKVIKYQQFFDMSGLLTMAGIPFIKNYIKKNKSPAGLIFYIGVFGALCVYVALELFSHNDTLSDAIIYICGAIPFFQISFAFGLGIMAYTSITYLGLIGKQKLMSVLMILCLIFKGLCFALLLRVENVIFYSFASSTFFAAVFVVATHSKKLYSSCKFGIN